MSVLTFNTAIILYISHIHVYILILLIFFLQVLLWINQSFLLQDDLSCEGNLNVAFMSLRGSGPLIIHMETTGQVCTVFYGRLVDIFSPQHTGFDLSSTSTYTKMKLK